MRQTIWGIALAGWLLLSGAAPGMAQEPPAPEAEAETPADAVSAAVRLTLRFRDQPELSGDYRVNADGTISVPVLGRIPVRRLTAADLEAELSRRVGEITGTESFATVEIAEYRPVYVTGAVTRSGATQWQPGLTVLQAVALSGGLPRAAEAAVGTPGAEPGRLAKAIDLKKRILAELARVRAERSGAEDVDVPPELAALAGPAEAERLIEAQRVLFRSRRDQVASQLTVLRRGRDLAADELDGLHEQADGIAEQLRLRRENAEKIRGLQQRGLAVAERGLEQELKVLELEEKSTNTSVALARVQASMAQLERDSVALSDTRAAESEQLAVQLEKDLAQVSLEIEAAAQLAGTALPDSTGALSAPVPAYRITRPDGAGGSRDIAAEEGTPLQPGDVLVVSMERR